MAGVASAWAFFVRGVVFFVGANDGPVVFFWADAGRTASRLSLNGFRGSGGFLLLRAEEWVVGCDAWGGW